MSHIHQDLDMSRIIAKVLTMGVFTNVVLPGGLLAICYYYDTNYPRISELGEFGHPLFQFLFVLAVAQAGLAIWWRGRRYDELMIKSRGTIEKDLVVGLLKATRPIFLMIAAISLYGCFDFAMTGQFKECLVFVMISFVVFQIVRPRYRQVRRLIDRQLELLGQEPETE